MNENIHRTPGLTRLKLLKALARNPGARAFELADMSGSPRGSTHVGLQRLEKQGLAESRVQGPEKPPVRRWWLTNGGRLELESLSALLEGAE